MRVASRLLVGIGLVGLLLSGVPGTVVSGAAAPLSTGWSSVIIDPPPSSGARGSQPFFLVRGGPGLVAISQAAGGGNIPSAWVSSDGHHWQYTSLDRQSFADVTSLSALALGKRGLVMVGTGSGASAPGHGSLPQGLVWTSSDGLSWRRVSNTGSIFKGASLSSVTATGTGYVAAGTVQSQASPTPAVNYRAAFWFSSDGEHWQPASDTGPSFKAAFIHDVSRGGPGLVAVGSAYSTTRSSLMPAIWTSVNGRSWRRLPLGTAFGTDGEIDRVVYGTKGLLALGHDTPADRLQQQILWGSRDGLGWRRVATDPFGLGHAPPALTALGSGFVAVGEYDNAPALWSSADGSRWTLAVGSDVFGGGLTTLTNAVAWRNGLVVVGQHTDPPVTTSSPTGQEVATHTVAWLWAPGTSTAPHPNWAADDPQWFRLRLADLGPHFIPRSATYGIACELIPEFQVRSVEHGRAGPAIDPLPGSARCERALAALDGSLVYSFNFGYGASNLYGPEPEVTGFAILTGSATQSSAAYELGDGIVIAGDLNLNAGTPRPERKVKIAEDGTLYSVSTQGFGRAYAVVWRSGRALGMVEVVGVPGDVKARALALARAQWQHWKAVGK